MIFLWVDGDSEYAEIFSDLERFVDFADPPFAAWVEEVHGYKLYGWEPYPERVSSYVRTGDLGHNWTFAKDGPGVYVFHNPTQYAIYVVGDDSGSGQAAVHVPFWWLALHVVEGELPILERGIEDYVEARFGAGLSNVGGFVT